MNNNNVTDTVDEIIDLTDVVSVGNAGEKNAASSAEEDVLDSLVSDFEKNLDAVPAANEEKDESDEPLDLAKLDNLINSYNLDFDDENNQGENQNANEIDTQKGMEVAFVQDNQSQNFQADIDKNINPGQADFNPAAQENNENNEIDENDIPSFEDIDLPSLEEEPEDDIDQLTKDIIDGTNTAQISPEKNMQENAPAQDDIFSEDNSFSALLNEEVQQQEAKPKQTATSQAVPQQTKGQAVSSNAGQNSSNQMAASKMTQAPLGGKTLNSNTAEDAEEINDDVFNNIFNELSLEHETDEEVVPFAHEAPSEAMPIHLKGDVSFIEAQGKEKANEDIHLVQSASKVLASGEAFLEKFNGEDDSVGAKIKNLSTRVVSLEQRLVGSDSKAQDNALELTYRINGLETKITELQEAVKAELITIKTDSAKIDSLAEENKKHENTNDLAVITEKIQAIETRVARLDDIFAEQKMLNDELSKNLDTLMQNAGAAASANYDNSGEVQMLQEKITALESELGDAQAKIINLEENIEKAASLAAAKVLREEIIPLLGQ